MPFVYLSYLLRDFRHTDPKTPEAGAQPLQVFDKPTLVYFDLYYLFCSQKL